MAIDVFVNIGSDQNDGFAHTLPGKTKSAIRLILSSLVARNIVACATFVFASCLIKVLSISKILPKKRQ